MITPGEVTKVRQGIKTAKLTEAEAKESPPGDLAKKEARPVPAAPPPPPPPAPAPKTENSDPVAEKLKEAPPPPTPPPAPAAPEQKKADAAPPPPSSAEKMEADALQVAEQRKIEEEK